MATILPEVEEHAIQEKELVGGPSNPMSRPTRDRSANRQSRLGLILGASAVGLALVLALVFGLWLLRSVRRLNRQVAHLNRQTEQLNRRVQAAEQQATASAQQASQAAADAQAAALQRDQIKGSQGMPAARTQSALAGTAVAQQSTSQAEPKPEEHRNQREEELQKLQHSLGQIAETRRTPLGLVMTLGDKSIRFDSGKSDVGPQYRGILNRIAGVLKAFKGYSIYVYGYTDDNGTKDYNLTLSARRARAVRDALVKAGIDPTLIRTKGFGKSQPRVRGSNPKARAANRRVEIGIVESTAASTRSTNVSKVATNR